MFRQAVALLTLAGLSLSSISCVVPSYTQVPTAPEQLAPGGQAVRVRAILTTSGGRIEFSAGARARVTRDQLVVSGGGATAEGPTVRIAETDLVRAVSPNAGRISGIPTRDGVQISGDIVKRKEGTITLALTEVIVPMSAVDQVLVERLSGEKTFSTTTAASVGAGALAITALLIYVALTKESCPFVYSYDGERYVLDGEPYGGAVSPGLKRTDWGRLEHLTEVGAEYRLKVTNEVDETQYTDELKLVVVDHPRGVSVVPDERGMLHGASAPVPPSRAVDTHGRDLLRYVAGDDWTAWRSAEEDLDPASMTGTKERLVFDFPKPAGATRARLIFNGGNTLWASQMLKRYLALHGRDLPAYHAALGMPGPVQLDLLKWVRRDEVTRMDIRVATPAGWITKGSIGIGGPFVTRPRLYTFDIADVPGDVLKVELTPAIGFWTINHLAVDYGADVAITAREIEADRAIDSAGTDIRPLLAATDNRYCVMPRTGDSADVVFKAPPRAADLERTVILKTNGYYDIHMGTLGDPQPAVLARISAEPGYFVRYAMGEYQTWQATLRAGPTR